MKETKLNIPNRSVEIDLDARPAQSQPMTAFSRRVYRIIRRVPHGQVISYGGVAALTGVPRAARGVGYVLSSLPEGADVPWWRVINCRGEISIRHDPIAARLQRVLLEGEGVEFDGEGRVAWDRFGWIPEELRGDGGE